MMFEVLLSEVQGRLINVEADSEQDVWSGNYTVVSHGDPWSVETTTVDIRTHEPSCDLCESPTTATHRWAALLNHNGGFEMWVCAACVSKHGEDKEDN